MKPKNSAKPEIKEFLLNRIYTPALKISYRSRWPRACEFSTSNINKLLDNKFRMKIYKALLKKQHNQKSSNISELLDL